MEHSPEGLKAQNPPTTVPKLFAECEKAMADAGVYLFLTRNAKLQKEQRDSLVLLKTRIRGYKQGAVDVGDERSANALFHAQCALNAIVSCLNMLLLVKQKDYHKAWSALIDAHEYVSIAKIAHDDGFDLEPLSKHLTHLELGLFPRFSVYHSWGVVIKNGKCTVCGEPFNTCDHVEGKVYWGKLCLRIAPEIVSYDHSAIVEEPKDRRCITTEVSTDDNHIRDYFTWKIKGEYVPEPGKLAKIGFVLFNNNLLEIN